MGRTFWGTWLSKEDQSRLVFLVSCKYRSKDEARSLDSSTVAVGVGHVYTSHW